MAPEELGAQLLTTLAAPHFRDPSAGVLQEPLGDMLPWDEVVAVGLDTNILKQLGRDRILADNLKATLASRSVALIIPGQCVIEFWNNYQKFASDDAQKLQNQVNNVKTVLKGMGALSLAEGRLEEMQNIVDDITKEVQEATTTDYLDKSRLMMSLLLQDALQPMVSRADFSALAIARQGCKVPPGFADEGRKVASYGDFYAWCDFLLGALSFDASSEKRTFVFVTDDAKPDWKTGQHGHPELIYEFHRVTGFNLILVGFSNLKKAINVAIRTSVAGESESEL